MSINDIVVVNITRETATVSRVGFGTPNILGINKAFPQRIKSYSSLDEVLVDFDSSAPEYVAASEIFAQEPTVTSIKISRRATSDTSVVTVSTVQDNTNYTITIDGEVFTFNSGGGATAITIAAGLVGLINGSGTLAVTATDNLDGTFDLDPDVASTAYAVKIESKLSIAFTTSGTVADDLTAINDENSDWYGLVYTDRTQGDVEAIATWVEAQLKLFVTASADANIINLTDSGDAVSIAAYAKANSLDRTMVFYHANAATEFIDAAMLGAVLPLDPGSYTMKFKTLASITVDSLNSTQRENALAKNANIYVTIAGVNITCDGKVGSGEFADVIVFIDWLTARLQERVYQLLVNAPKVPYTDAGIASIEAEVRAQLQDGIAIGGLAADPEPTVTVPAAADVPPGDKATRVLNNVNFTGTLSGAIHKVFINGTVSV